MTVYITHHGVDGAERNISRATAVEILRRHGWAPQDQTATLDGIPCESGTSFDEAFGIAQEYIAAAVYRWLGY